jgi:hypothetical protein
MSIGTIPIDALFAPIRKVNYTVTNARVGQQTDYDKLTLEVWTNGSVKPQDAVAYAAKILKEQLSIFINFEETEETQYAPAGAEDEPLNENLFRSVDELELSVRSANCLQNANISSSASSFSAPSRTCSRRRTSAQEPEGDQGDPGEHGAVARHEDRQLAADARALEAAAAAELGFPRSVARSGGAVPAPGS